MKYKRIFVLILDSLGVGAAPDAALYNDTNANTLKNITNNYDLFIPNLKKLGFLATINNDEEESEAYYTIAKPSTPGKDSLSGHYELFGIENPVAFSHYAASGFPRDLIEKIEEITRLRVIGNKATPGLEIINELGNTHLQYGALIVFTSSDSTLQIAAHERIIPPAKLYEFAEAIREVTDNIYYRIGRVIARPFTGKPGDFKFTTDRRDYAVKPPENNILNNLKNQGLNVIGIGKIGDVFNHEGITKNITAKDNINTINKLTDIMDKDFTGLCITNLEDFDKYGHQRDVISYAEKIEELDVEIPIILNKLNNDDLLIITADHGNDPTYTGNDHTRENVPVLIYNHDFKNPKRFRVLNSFADVGATIAHNFEIEAPTLGESFLDELN